MSRYDDDLGRLIRTSLSRLAAEAEPSPGVWARIEAQIKECTRNAGGRSVLGPESPPYPLPPTLQLMWPGMILIRI